MRSLAYATKTSSKIHSVLNFQSLEEWQSGRMRLIRNQKSVKVDRGFESLFFRYVQERHALFFGE